MWRVTSARGREMIRAFEGERLESYRCPAGKWTISVGVTGPHVTEGMKITQAESDELFAAALRGFEQGANKLVTAPLTQNMWDAIISLVYNIGLGSFRSSTLLRYLNRGEHRMAAAEFGRWVHAGGQLLPGLAKRRRAEAEMFLQRD
jgi:lysozyme